MKACEQYINAIHERVDGTLGPLRRAELDLHLESCEACANLLADLQQIADAARGLEPLQPPDRVWLQIAGQLRQQGRLTPAPVPMVRRSPVLLALAAALLLAVGSSLLLLVMHRPAAPSATAAADVHATPGNAEPDDPVQGVDSELVLAEQHLQKAIDDAQKTDGAVDVQTVAVLQKNLQVVNQAVAESRAALKSDPQSAPARQSLYEALKQKIQFLQDTIALMNEMRQGDAEGAARIVEGKS